MNEKRIYRLRQPYNKLDYRIALRTEEAANLIAWLNVKGFFSDETFIEAEDESPIYEI